MMRTTLAIDDDLIMAAKGLAQEQKKSMGEIVSMLMRKALQPAQVSDKERNGVPLLSVRPGTPVVTLELVNQLRDEIP